MEDKHSRIKRKVQACYDAIKKAEEDLRTLRNVCSHPKSERKKDVDYMWRIGSTMKADICGICGEVIMTDHMPNKRIKLNKTEENEKKN
jgi:hypothetical protein